MGWFSKTLWLVAEDPDGSWWCDCRNGIVDATWHNKETFPTDGSGWLWTCANCSRGFMFARCKKIRGTLEQLAQKQTPRKQKYISPSGDMVENTLLDTPSDWMNLIEPIQNAITEGERYVFFDGVALPAKHGPVKFDGLFRSHNLPDLPHLSESLMEKTIANPDYWSVN